MRNGGGGIREERGAYTRDREIKKAREMERGEEKLRGEVQGTRRVDKEKNARDREII